MNEFLEQDIADAYASGKTDAALSIKPRAIQLGFGGPLTYQSYYKGYKEALGGKELVQGWLFNE